MARQRNWANHARLRSTTPCDLPAAGCSQFRAGRCGDRCDGGSAPDDSSGGRRPCQRAASRAACAAVPGISGSAGRHPRLPPASGCMHIRARQLESEGDTLRIGGDVALRAQLAQIGWVRARRRAPLLAAIEALSREARLKSMPFQRPRRSSSACRRHSTLRVSASPASATSRSCPSHSPSPGVATPTPHLTAPRTGSPLAPHSRRFEADHSLAWPVQAAAAARSRPFRYREGAV